MALSRSLGKLRMSAPISLVSAGLRISHMKQRQFHVSPAYCTDGVYKDLTNMRVKTPWIEALRKQREDGVDPTKQSSIPATPANRDLRHRKMSDSFHRVVYTRYLYLAHGVTD